MVNKISIPHFVHLLSIQLGSISRENQLVGVFSIQLVPALKPRNSSRFLEERHKNRGNMTAGQHAGFLRVISQVLLRMCFLLWSDLFGSDGLEML